MLAAPTLPQGETPWPHINSVPQTELLLRQVCPLRLYRTALRSPPAGFYLATSFNNAFRLKPSQASFRKAFT